MEMEEDKHLGAFCGSMTKSAFICAFIFSTSILLIPPVQPKRGLSPGRRRRRREEAACNIEEREEEVEKREEVKIPKPLEERGQEEGERASEVEEQVGRHERRLGGRGP